MKLKDLIRTREALTRLTEKRFTSYKVIRSLVALRKAVDTEVDIYLEQEKKAVKTYAELDEKGNPIILSEGRIRLKDEKSKTLFDQELTRLRESEVDGIDPVTLKEEDFCSSGDIPTPSDILLLEPIVVLD